MAKSTSTGKTISRSQPSEEGKVMNSTFKKAAKKARAKAFTKLGTLLVEKDGWLVRVAKSGKVTKRVKKLEPILLPAA